MTDQPKPLKEIDPKIHWEQPNAELELFKARMIWDSLKLDVQLEAANLLLRGTVLKNTPYVVGVVMYTGSDTKVRQCVKQTGQLPPKYSAIFRSVNRYLGGMFVLQIILCIFAAIFSTPSSSVPSINGLTLILPVCQSEK
jgi:magnesium-transporting ATPase (P-type)